MITKVFLIHNQSVPKTANKLTNNIYIEPHRRMGEGGDQGSDSESSSSMTRQ